MRSDFVTAACVGLALLALLALLTPLGGCSEAPRRGGPADAGAPPAAAGDGSAPQDLSAVPAGDGAPAAPEAGAGSPEAGTTTPGGPTNLPAANGPCPELVSGDVTFHPKGIKARQARIWIGSAAKTKDGPVVFYWHGTGMSPKDASWSIGKQNIDEILALGGIVVAPHADPSTTYPWFIANGDNRPDDLLVADEIVACAIKKIGIDARRIHSTGMSAGGMITCDLALRRANYVASTSPKSGGLSPWNKVPQNAEPKNKSAAMIFHGGATDTWGKSLSYVTISEKFRDEIVKNGGFAFICNHGKGHTVPTDAVDAVWRFFKDHPWNTTPSPYAKGLPAGSPGYCKLP